MVRGSKHWPLSKQKRLWDWLTPKLPSIFEGISPETQTAWEMCAECTSPSFLPPFPRSASSFCYPHELTFSDFLDRRYPQRSRPSSEPAARRLPHVPQDRRGIVGGVQRLEEGRPYARSALLFSPLVLTRTPSYSCRYGDEGSRLALLALGVEVHRGSSLSSRSFPPLPFSISRARLTPLRPADVFEQHRPPVPGGSRSSRRQPSRPLRASPSPFVRLRRRVPQGRTAR